MNIQKQIVKKRKEISRFIDLLSQKALRPQSYKQKRDFLKEQIELEEQERRPGWAMRVEEMKDEQNALEICIISFKEDSKKINAANGFDNYVEMLFAKQEELFKNFKDFNSAKKIHEDFYGKTVGYSEYLQQNLGT